MRLYLNGYLIRTGMMMRKMLRKLSNQVDVDVHVATVLLTIEHVCAKQEGSLQL